MFTKTKNAEEFLKIQSKSDIGDIVNYSTDLFNFALEMGASDIHVEPTKDFVMIRFRQSGDFIYVDKMNHDEYAKLISRVKILANMRIDEKHKPQDGKI